MKQLPTGRTLAEFKPLKPAEDQLLDACKSGLLADLLLRPHEVSTGGIFDPGVLKEAHHPRG
jgi:hypothetical protein